MSEWWTYGPRDLLMFSARTYERLFERYNDALWPLHAVALALGVVVLVLLRRGDARAGQGIAAILAIVWAWIAWGFHWQYYASINLAAGAFVLAFALQAILMLAALRSAPRPAAPLQQHAAIALLLFALAYPLLTAIFGRPWLQAEVFGLASDPTALATLAVLLHRRGKWWLYLIPLAWCFVSGATLWAMGRPDFFIVPLAALLAVALAL
jgi:hypothetical protein